ncbi:transcriptional regulator [Brucella melitensis]|nr:transcriptional regulator [Brucella melitensis]
MTIRKNTDQSIPASHLIEMVFTVPEGFPGGAIDNVQRITFKDTEQAAGNPLIAVPSKIADNFFIIWLNRCPHGAGYEPVRSCAACSGSIFRSPTETDAAPSSVLKRACRVKRRSTTFWGAN